MSLQPDSAWDAEHKRKTTFIRNKQITNKLSLGHLVQGIIATAFIQRLFSQICQHETGQGTMLMSFTILSASMIDYNLWAIMNSVTPDPRLARSECWTTASVPQSMAEVVRREFTRSQNAEIVRSGTLHPHLRSKAYYDG